MEKQKNISKYPTLLKEYLITETKWTRLVCYCGYTIHENKYCCVYKEEIYNSNEPEAHLDDIKYIVYDEEIYNQNDFFKFLRDKRKED